MRAVVLDAQQGFGGGLNTVADDAAVQPNQMRVATNFLQNEFGGAVKRRGCQHLHTTALQGGVPIQSGYGWNQVSGNVLLVIVNGKLYTGTTGTLPRPFTLQAGSLLATGNPDMIAFEDGTSTECVYIADGGTTISKWDGTTLTNALDPSTPAGITRLCVYNDRLFGITGLDQSLWWSTLGNGDTLGDAGTGGGQDIVRTFSNQRLIALGTVGQSLMLAHVGGISVFTGWTQDDINISAGTTGLTSDVGTIAPRCFISIENEILMLSDRGFYSVTEAGVTPISVTIDDQVSGLSATQLAASFAVHYRSRREVWFYISGLGIYVFQYRLRTWMGPLNGGYLVPISTCGFEALDVTGASILLLGDTTGYVKQAQMAGVFLDNVLADGSSGSVITATLQQHRMFCAAPGGPSSFEMTKAWRFAYLLFDPRGGASVTFAWATQYGSGSWAIVAGAEAWGTGTWGMGTWGGSGVVEFRVPLGGRGNFIDCSIVDSSLAESLYSRSSVEAYALGRRG